MRRIPVSRATCQMEISERLLCVHAGKHAIVHFAARAAVASIERHCLFELPA